MQKKPSNIIHQVFKNKAKRKISILLHKKTQNWRDVKLSILMKTWIGILRNWRKYIEVYLEREALKKSQENFDYEGLAMPILNHIMKWQKLKQFGSGKHVDRSMEQNKSHKCQTQMKTEKWFFN
jgi:hypothetical protein